MVIFRPLHITLMVAATVVILLASALAQTPPDSLPCPADSLRIIPCGQAVGLFYPQARVTVADTVAGWAKVYVEGWIPLETALPFLNRPQLASPLISNGMLTAPDNQADLKKVTRVQCEAITSKGKRCSRKAEKGSKYCWQHQQR